MDEEAKEEMALVGLDSVEAIEEAQFQLDLREATEAAKDEKLAQFDKIDPRYELAIRLYASGAGNQREVCSKCNIKSLSRFNVVLNSDEGQAVMVRVRNELDQQFQGLFKKVINVINDGLDHAETGVGLAAASLWLKTQKGNKVVVELTAEDIVAKLMGEDKDGEKQE